MMAVSGYSIVPVKDSESSMLKAEIRKYILDRFQSILKTQYEKKFLDMGGTEGVLKDLENYIVIRLNSLKANAGDAARSALSKRPEINGEVGRYHTALRALLDNDNTMNWDSVLHQGSTIMFDGVNLREFLAYYWLAASDESMEMAEIFACQIKNPQQRIEFLNASKENFVDVLANIRRAHNEGLYTNASHDRPSCIPGTFGRIAFSSIYNIFTAIETPPYQDIPQEIQNFIIESLRQMDDEHKVAIFNFINNKLIDIDIAASDQEIYSAFISSFSEPDSLNRLYAHLHTTIKGLSFAQNSEILKGNVIKLLYLELCNLQFNDTSAIASGQFINRFINEGLASIATIELQASLLSCVLEYRLFLRAIEHELKVTQRLISNELIRGALVPEYMTSDKFKDKLMSLHHHNDLIVHSFGSAKSHLKGLAHKKVALVTKKILEDTAHRPNITEKITENAITKNYQFSTQKRIANIEQVILDIDALFNGKWEKLPTKVGIYTVSYVRRTPDEWALNVIRIATELEQNGDLVADARELQRLAELMKVSFENNCNPVLRKINELIDNPEVVRIDKKKEVRDFINATFAPYSLNLDADEAKTINAFEVQLQQFLDENESTYSILNSNEIRTIAMYPLYRNSSIDETNTFDEKNYDAWKQQALTLIADDIPKNIGLLKRFVLLTVFANLQIDSIRKNDADAIEWLCDLYLGLNITDRTLTNLPFSIAERREGQLICSDLDVQTRINFLTGHLSCLLTTLKDLPHFFSSGHLCLMSRDQATAKVWTSSEERPYIVRLSNSEPNTVVVTLVKRTEKECLNKYFKHKADSEKVYTIEGKEFKFPDITSEELIKFLTSIGAVTPIGGIVPLAELSEPTYRTIQQDNYRTVYGTERMHAKNAIKKAEERIYGTGDERVNIPRFGLSSSSESNSDKLTESAETTASLKSSPTVDSVPALEPATLDPVPEIITDEVNIEAEQRVQNDSVDEEIQEELPRPNRARSQSLNIVIRDTTKQSPEAVTLNAFKSKFHLDINSINDLKFWSNAVTFRGAKVNKNSKDYKIPQGIFDMMTIIDSEAINPASKLQQLSQVRDARNKDGKIFCLPFFKIYRKNNTDECYLAAEKLKQAEDENAPLLGRFVE